MKLSDTSNLDESSIPVEWMQVSVSVTKSWDHCVRLSEAAFDLLPLKTALYFLEGMILFLAVVFFVLTRDFRIPLSVVPVFVGGYLLRRLAAIEFFVIWRFFSLFSESNVIYRVYLTHHGIIWSYGFRHPRIGYIPWENCRYVRRLKNSYLFKVPFWKASLLMAGGIVIPNDSIESEQQQLFLETLLRHAEIPIRTSWLLRLHGSETL